MKVWIQLKGTLKMNQKKSQKQCSGTKKEYQAVTTRKQGNKKVYELTDKKGGIFKLVLPLPITKLGQKLRNMFFQKTRKG